MISDDARKRAREWLEECGRIMGPGPVLILPEVEESLAELLELGDAAQLARIYAIERICGLDALGKTAEEAVEYVVESRKAAFADVRRLEAKVAETQLRLDSAIQLLRESFKSERGVKWLDAYDAAAKARRGGP